MVRLPLAVLSIVFVACSSDPKAGGINDAGTKPGPAAPNQATETPPSDAPTSKGLRCPLVPMKLVLTAEGQTTALVELEANGDVYVLREISTLSETPKPIGKLDTRGCIAAAKKGEPVVAEHTNGSSIWTLRSMLPTNGADLSLPSGTVTITADGTVKARNDDTGGGDMHFEGYRPDALCTAQLLYATFLSAMPSMAVADGVATELPPPTESVCPELHQHGAP